MENKLVKKHFSSTPLTRRDFLYFGSVATLFAATKPFLPSQAWTEAAPSALRAGSVVEIKIDIRETPFEIDGKLGTAVAMNGMVPGPIIRLKEGRDAVLHVTNYLSEATSIHWHGIILPPEMDGVPGVSFAGIPPGETFTYRFPVKQSGTYWCHSHSGGQELLGLYAPLIIDPIIPDPFTYDRDYVVLLSDWSFESPEDIIDNLKKQAGYYNFQKRTVGEFIRAADNDGLLTTAGDWLEWTKMRMDPTDFADVTGATYTYLMNGHTSASNWSGLFTKGEKVRLRFIDAGAMTYFDLRIPGLKMTLVQADGQNIEPVEIDEFRIGPGETFDVIVEPKDDAYTIFAESLDRSGYVSGTLASSAGMVAAIPERRPRPLRTMADMGMGEMNMGGFGAIKDSHSNMDMKTPLETKDAHIGMGNMAKAKAPSNVASKEMNMFREVSPRSHSTDTHGVGNSVIPMSVGSRLKEPGTGLENSNTRVLTYADLRSALPQLDMRKPEREVELHLTGNMERYMWSFDGKKYSEAKTPIPFRYGERLRLILVNDTMMEHPIHLHGMFMELENGAEGFQPRKHTVSVKPAERLTVAITADAPGKWAMHCHLLLHMDMGMFRVVEVSAPPEVVR